ncbi:hypothetical protein OSB04_001981 [Centaurea solstitialis]|uniref:F-box/LRR-repeat protein 23 n=1 Tax=Centaurea solstitialis TaxID=347529 RepID=A0AA38WSY8_9ASTR|nr:hypothetical protein OSB04_001981 [Centaurea solstitialis]
MENRNWLEMPDVIMGGMIFPRLGTLEIIKSVQIVCTTWRRICKNDPGVWKVIEISHHTYDRGYESYGEDIFANLGKQAVDRSCGQLIDITLVGFDTFDLLDYISQRSRKLTRLCITACFGFKAYDLINALKRLPHLETLKLSYISTEELDIEVVGQSCPQLKSFTLKKEFMDTIDGVQAIAKSMPTLRHLKLVDSTMYSDDGFQAILNGCPHLESLDLLGCPYFHLDKNLEKLFRERIKDLKYDIPEEYEDSETEFLGDY